MDLKKVLNHFELTDGPLLGTTTVNASTNHLLTPELQPTLGASQIEWPALRTYIPCMAHFIQLALGGFMGTLSVKDCTKSCEANECNQNFVKNECTDIVKSQRLRTESNAGINKVVVLKTGLAKIIENIHISTYFDSPENNLHIAVNAR